LSGNAVPSIRRAGGRRTALIWTIVIVVAGILCWQLQGSDALEASLQSYVVQLGVVLPRMAAALLISGFIQVLVPHDLVRRWLGKSAGLKGVCVATGVGALTPGGPMLAFPLVIVLRNAGASTAALITFLTSWATLGFHRILMWELPLLGSNFASVRYLASIPLPFVAGAIVLACASAAERRGARRR
jgi:uncharacterized membrane protein YraQ (UPF0718 family)